MSQKIKVDQIADVTATSTELNYTDGVTSAIQTQLDAKLPTTGGAMTGAITTNSTFDGRDVATDGTKLDTIESSADVTDATNVTAAGALMDSEVTNLAQVKAFDSSDYATAAQGTTADAALARTGGAMTGAITTNSTFDGRDVATDGTKLDTIETSADVTDATNVTAAGAAMKANNLSDLPNASTARTNLGVAIGSNVQAYDADLTAIGGLAKTDSNIIVGNGSTWVAENGATARTSLGLTIGTNVQAYSSVLQNTTASFLTADETKLDYITVTQAVSLDQMEIDIAALENGMVYKGDWDASAGSFPGSGSAQVGWFYYVSVAGTVDSVAFAVGDNIVALTDNASTSTYAGNWSKHDQTDAVQAVVGLTGSIAKSSLLSALNVEDGADVTDTTNVTSAGALMDSEVTNLAQVKAFDSSDYATAAQGTTADAALPRTGGAMTGAITTNSTFDGRDVATDGTKLDTIETNADVTDTANVTSAGALMDSEVTNLAQVKAFDSSDYATAAQGTTADAALPTTGGAMTGAITTNSTFDGRDVATDGAKLDGIAAGATNVTNNNQITNGAGYTTNAGDITNVSVSGTGLSGGGASGSVTITSNATSANTASTIVARDGSGNFTAGVITGTATEARYADLAEKYTSDADYEPGTVVELGGEAEVTQSTGLTSRRIAGIVSTNPAHLMNNELEADHVVDVALIGRVPCKVIGVFNKGDILISSNTHGHACAWTNATNPPAGSAIGKAIESKTDLGAGIIEVLVGRM